MASFIYYSCERTLDISEVMSTDLTAEFIFVVDTSGSMQGAPMENTKNCLQIFLRSLPEGAMFNVYNFDSGFASVWPTSKPYNDINLQAASHFVAMLRADNSTELLEPLQHIYSSQPLEGYPRQIFVLTDGEVSNSQQVINLTQQNAHLARVFSFGIGSSVSRTLVEGIAKAGGGEAEFVVDNNKVYYLSISFYRQFSVVMFGLMVYRLHNM
jgi:uncharacterized protein with von Willebrand factor type A (vWA) domain